MKQKFQKVPKGGYSRSKQKERYVYIGRDILRIYISDCTNKQSLSE